MLRLRRAKCSLAYKEFCSFLHTKFYWPITQLHVCSCVKCCCDIHEAAEITLSKLPFVWTVVINEWCFVFSQTLKTKDPKAVLQASRCSLYLSCPLCISCTNTFSKQIRKLWIISQAIQQFVSGLNNVNNTANDWWLQTQRMLSVFIRSKKKINDCRRKLTKNAMLQVVFHVDVQ